jgi:hypothetical protein
VKHLTNGDLEDASQLIELHGPQKSLDTVTRLKNGIKGCAANFLALLNLLKGKV